MTIRAFMSWANSRGFPSVELPATRRSGFAPLIGRRATSIFHWFKDFGHFRITNGVAALVNDPGAKFDDVSERFAAALLVVVDCFVSGGNSMDIKAVKMNVTTGVEADWQVREIPSGWKQIPDLLQG